MCYARITPAALHRGEFRRRRCHLAEAAGRNPKFGLIDFRRVSASEAAPILQAF
jgi:hypothetical protein